MAGGAVVKPCGTDILPTRAARPIVPETGAPPTLVEVRFAPSELAIGASEPLAAFAGAKNDCRPCPFCAYAYTWPNDRNGPPGIEVSPCAENGPVMVDTRVFQFARLVTTAGGSVAEPICGSASPGRNDVDPVVGDAATVDAKPCSAFGSELMNWDSCVVISEPAAVPVSCDAAACAVPEAFVVWGGSLKGVNCVATADDPA